MKRRPRYSPLNNLAGLPVGNPDQWYQGALHAYQAKHVASYDASKLNLGSSGLNLTENTTAVPWAEDTGWTFSTSHFDIDYAPGLDRTLLVAARTTVLGSFAAGAFTSPNPNGIYIIPRTGSGVQYTNGGNLKALPDCTDGIMVVAGDKGYRNGYDEGITLTTGGVITSNLKVGALGGFASQFEGQIHAFGYWDRVLSASEVEQVCLLLRKRIGRPKQKEAVFFGDSITVGTGASTEADRWVNRVATAKSWATNWANEGISGTVLQNTDGLGNNGRDTFKTRILRHSPEYVFILYGLNDLRYNSVNFTIETFQNDLTEIVDNLTKIGAINPTKIVIGSPPRMNPAFYTHAPYAPYDAGSESKQVAYQAACQSVARLKGCLYADVYAAMVANGGDSLVSADGVHPNDSGHEVIADTFLSVLP